MRLGDDTLAKVWMDSWAPDGPISLFALSLFQAIGKRRQNRTVRDALTQSSGAPTAPVLYGSILYALAQSLRRLAPTSPCHQSAVPDTEPGLQAWRLVAADAEEAAQ